MSVQGEEAAGAHGRGKTEPPPSVTAHHRTGVTAEWNHALRAILKLLTVVKQPNFLSQHTYFYSPFYANLLPECSFQGCAQKGRNTG